MKCHPILVLLIVLCICFVLQYWIQQTESPRLTSVYTKRALNHNADQILVLIWYDAKQNIHDIVQLANRLHNTAFIPPRLRMVAAYASTKPFVIPPSSSMHASLELIPVDDNLFRLGPMMQLSRLLALSYVHEDYIFIVHPTMIPTSNWDDIFIKSSQTVHDQGLITQHLASYFSSNSTFSVLESNWSQKIPSFQSRYSQDDSMMYRSPTIKIQSVFGSYQNIRLVLEHVIPYTCHTEVEFLIMCYIHQRPLFVYTPFKSVGHKSADPTSFVCQTDRPNIKLIRYRDEILHHLLNDTFRMEASNHKFFQNMVINQGESYIKWIGFNQRLKHIKGHWMLGVDDRVTTQEQISKYGSVHHFKNLRRSLCFD